MRTKRQPVCTEPLAPVVKCVVCGADVHTCENHYHLTDKRCPAHPEGCELRGGGWTCSESCYTTAVLKRHGSDE
jgi:hypothetical protein